jgi:hypothetical protein
MAVGLGVDVADEVGLGAAEGVEVRVLIEEAVGVLVPVGVGA